MPKAIIFNSVLYHVITEVMYLVSGDWHIVYRPRGIQNDSTNHVEFTWLTGECLLSLLTLKFYGNIYFML